MKKRVLSLLLLVCLCLLFTVTLGMAAEASPQCLEGCSLEEGHDGECVLHEARYQTEADGQWVYGSLAAACANVYSGGTVEVLRDIALESSVTTPKALTITSADPEAPCKITYAAKDRGDFLLKISAEGVILADIILDGGREEGLTAYAELVGVGYYLKKGTLTMKAGAVLQNNDNVSTDEAAGGLRVLASSTAIMEEGSVIRNCRGVAGGGAAVANVSSTLILNGGVIENCQAIVGGGVFMQENGTFQVYGGAIRNNEAVREIEGLDYSFNDPPGSGGGIYVEQGRIYLRGGSVTGNRAEGSGGGLFVYNGLVQLANGAVTENYAQRYGGGIVASPVAYLVVGMYPQVMGNTCGEKYFYDLYLDGYEDGSTADYTRPMTIGTGLLDGACLGVARWLRPDKDHPYRIVAVPNATYTITESDLEKFFSNDPHYVVLLHEGNIVLANADVMFDNQGHGVAPQSQRVGDDRKVIEPEALTEEGYTFGGWYQEPECENAWDFESGTVAEYAETPLILYAQWEPVPYPIIYEMDGGTNAESNPDGYNIESAAISLEAPTKEGYTFLGWTGEGESDPQKSAGIPAGSTGERRFTAHWAKEETPPAKPDDPGPVWRPEEPYTPPAALESGEHFAYIVGYPDGSVQPEAYISRAEAASVFFRLMTDAFRAENWSGSNPFSDVAPEKWYNNAVSTVVQAGLIRGYPDGTFGGEENITRAEFAAIAARFLSEENAPDSGFPDLEGHWAKEEVDRAVAAGWLKGFPDGNFYPDAYITRAEVMVLVNRMLDRKPDSEGMREGMTLWPDNPDTAWYYADVQEATNGHTYDRDRAGSPETWTGLTEKRDWTELER